MDSTYTVLSNVFYRIILYINGDDQDVMLMD